MNAACTELEQLAYHIYNLLFLKGLMVINGVSGKAKRQAVAALI